MIMLSGFTLVSILLLVLAVLVLVNEQRDGALSYAMKEI